MEHLPTPHSPTMEHHITLIHQGKCLASSSAKYLQLLLRVNPDVCCGTTDQHSGGQNQGVRHSTQCEPSATLQFPLKKIRSSFLDPCILPNLSISYITGGSKWEKDARVSFLIYAFSSMTDKADCIFLLYIGRNQAKRGERIDPVSIHVWTGLLILMSLDWDTWQDAHEMIHITDGVILDLSYFMNITLYLRNRSIFMASAV